MTLLLQSTLKCMGKKHLLGFARTFAFKSDLSPEVLYPNSNQKLFTAAPPPTSEKFNGYIPMDSLQIKYSKSSGPGGQNVNKVDTKVDLRFHIDSAGWISESIRQKLSSQYKNHINKDGYFIIKSDLTRFQHMNLADALEKLRNIIRDLEAESEIKEVSPEKVEEIRRRKEKAARERLFQKRDRGQVKANRRA